MQPVYEAAKAYCVMLGKSTAQTALHFGANDLEMTKREIMQMIERGGFEAVERDTVYNRLNRVAEI